MIEEGGAPRQGVSGKKAFGEKEARREVTEISQDCE